MTAKLLITLAWTLWGLLLVGLAFVTLRMLTERARSPEAGRGLGLGLVLLLLALLLAAGAGVDWAAKRQSVVALTICCLVLAYPLVALIAGPVVKGIKQRRWRREAARAGDFRGPEKELIDAIRRRDATRLRELLANQRVPEGRDRAGLSVLEFAVVSMCKRGTSLDCVRALLAAGATARDGKDRNGLPLIALLLISHASVPDYREAISLLLQHGASADQRSGGDGMTLLHHAGEHPDIVRLLVEHGADVESLDEYGQSPVVRFTGQGQWDAARYLVERGVRLDVVTPTGVSVDYYLRDWKDSVYGEHPEGWEGLRAAIAKRRASAQPSPPTERSNP